MTAERLLMVVDDVFRFGDGRTVITGRVISGPTIVGRTTCLLFVDDKVMQKIDIQGEELVEKRVPTDRRAVWTFNEVSLSNAQLQTAACELRETVEA